MRVEFSKTAGLGCLILCAVLGGGCAGVRPEEGPARGGSGEMPGLRIREGVGRGYRGPVEVRVEFSGDLIRDIEIISHGEDEFTGLAAMEELLALVLETGSTDLDAVSGATQSSKGFLEAVEHAKLSP